MKGVTVAMAGAGWAGAMHARSYRKVYGVDYRLKTLCGLEQNLAALGREFGFEQTVADYDALLADDEIDVIDVASPPSLHSGMIEKALMAGKHVICEKPLTGAFQKEAPEQMLSQVMAEAGRLEEIIHKTGRIFCYAENWIYSPPFITMARLIQEKRSRIMVIEGVTGHKGSHADHANYWQYNGGGTLIRQGSHPIAAALWLKRLENALHHEEFSIQSVLCDTAQLTKKIKEKKYIDAAPVDVEDWARLVITFGDGTKADIMAGDMMLGGIKNGMKIYGNDAAFTCNMTPNNLLEAYFSDDLNIENYPVMEKNDHNKGMILPLVAEEAIRGYEGQLQNFMECIAKNKQPESGFQLAKETLAVLYAGYLSAEKNCRIQLSAYL